MWVGLILVRSRIGRAITSLADSEIGAASLGINSCGLKVAVFVLSASLAALAGSLYVHYTRFVSPETFNFFASVLLVMMVAVGGWGKYWGPFFGALVFTVIPEFLQSFNDLQLFIFGPGNIVVRVFVAGVMAGMVVE